MNPAAEIGVITGSYPYNIMFDKVTANIIGNNSRTYSKSYPPPVIFFVIDSNDQNQKQIKRHPGNGIADSGH
jgi:hypothetical protein